MATVSVSSSLVRAALDTTKPKLRYNPNAPRNVKINPNSTTSFVPPSSPAARVLTTTGTTSVSVSDLLKRPASKGNDFRFPLPGSVIILTKCLCFIMNSR